MLIDSHCHLGFPGLYENIDEVVAAARRAGIVRMLTVATNKDCFDREIGIAHKYEDVYCALGVHPHHAQEEEISSNDLVLRAADSKVIAIGETGLDYFYDHSPRAAQEKCFREHIRAGITAGLPIIIHSREAEADTIRILKDERKGHEQDLTGVLHCFSSKQVLAEEGLAIGFYVSVSGIATFKKSQDLRDIIKNIPLDRLLVETDSPYLAPQSRRGKTCQPAYVEETARVLADIKQVSFDEIAAQTTENFFRLFRKAPPL
ncbi:MAG: TatD family hydrolase [Alphaproteobacteria bacterium]|nr:TatD family hydrolase [Alphaproteobacteria bacterium]